MFSSVYALWQKFTQYISLSMDDLIKEKKVKTILKIMEIYKILKNCTCTPEVIVNNGPTFQCSIHQCLVSQKSVADKFQILHSKDLNIWLLYSYYLTHYTDVHNIEGSEDS